MKCVYNNLYAIAELLSMLLWGSFSVCNIRSQGIGIAAIARAEHRQQQKISVKVLYVVWLSIECNVTSLPMLPFLFLYPHLSCVCMVEFQLYH